MVLEPLSRAGFDRIPRDRGRLFGWALAAEVARATHDVEAAARLEPLLRSCAALAVVAGSGTVYYGPVAHHQGELAATLGRFDEALERFAAARGAEERAGAPLWRARTQLALARVRASRGGDGDAQAAERTRAEVARIAAERAGRPCCARPGRRREAEGGAVQRTGKTGPTQSRGIRASSSIC